MSVNDIDFQTFSLASKLAPDSRLQGQDLQEVFWRYKALERELARQKAYWKSTNDTLAKAFEELQHKDRELEQQHVLLSHSNDRLRALTDRLQHELSLARQIQQSLLPPQQPIWSGLSVFCYCNPAWEVGGDFYDYHPLDDKRFALAVGDVSDKGMSAALLMAISLAQFDTAQMYTLAPHELLAHLDRTLVRYTAATGQNCALCYVEVDGTKLHMSNAGGIPPYVRHAGGEVERFDIGGMPLGVGLGAEAGYQSVSVELQPEDMVILISDGVVEASGVDGTMFGFDRFEQAVAAGPEHTPHAMLDYLTHQIAAFVGDAEPHDDLTIVVFQIKP